MFDFPRATTILKRTTRVTREDRIFVISSDPRLSIAAPLCDTGDRWKDSRDLTR